MARNRKYIEKPEDKDALTPEKVSIIKQMINEGQPIHKIATQVGVTYGVVYGIRKQNTWKEIEPQIILSQHHNLRGKSGVAKELSHTSTAQISPSLLAGWGYTDKK